MDPQGCVLAGEVSWEDQPNLVLSPLGRGEVTNTADGESSACWEHPRFSRFPFSQGML